MHQLLFFFPPRLNRSIVASASFFSLSTRGSVIHGYLVSLTWPGTDLLRSQRYDARLWWEKLERRG